MMDRNIESYEVTLNSYKYIVEGIWYERVVYGWEYVPSLITDKGTEFEMVLYGRDRDEIGKLITERYREPTWVKNGVQKAIIRSDVRLIVSMAKKEVEYGRWLGNHTDKLLFHLLHLLYNPNSWSYKKWQNEVYTFCPKEVFLIKPYSGGKHYFPDAEWLVDNLYRDISDQPGLLGNMYKRYLAKKHIVPEIEITFENMEKNLQKLDPVFLGICEALIKRSAKKDKREKEKLQRRDVKNVLRENGLWK